MGWINKNKPKLNSSKSVLLLEKRTMDLRIVIQPILMLRDTNCSLRIGWVRNSRSKWYPFQSFKFCCFCWIVCWIVPVIKTSCKYSGYWNTIFLIQLDIKHQNNCRTLPYDPILLDCPKWSMILNSTKKFRRTS